jgi:hypothetical protein
LASKLSILSVPDEGFCALNLMSTFLLQNKTKTGVFDMNKPKSDVKVLAINTDLLE